MHGRIRFVLEGEPPCDAPIDIVLFSDLVIDDDIPCGVRGSCPVIGPSSPRVVDAGRRRPVDTSPELMFRNLATRPPRAALVEPMPMILRLLPVRVVRCLPVLYVEVGRLVHVQD